MDAGHSAPVHFSSLSHQAQAGEKQLYLGDL